MWPEGPANLVRNCHHTKHNPPQNIVETLGKYYIRATSEPTGNMYASSTTNE